MPDFVFNMGNHEFYSNLNEKENVEIIDILSYLFMTPHFLYLKDIDYSENLNKLYSFYDPYLSMQLRKSKHFNKKVFTRELIIPQIKTIDGTDIIVLPKMNDIEFDNNNNIAYWNKLKYGCLFFSFRVWMW